jgi:asparagine synthase (glutamine-hydrolysing)
LYYATTDESIVFASETKAILLDESVSRKPELDFASIDHYVTHRRVSNASTMFKSIKKLLPAHTLLCQDGKLKIDRYWQVNVEENGHGRANDYIEQFFELFRDAVRLRLISDVPLGAHLSGGIDSSSIVALMAAMSDRSVETFSVGFDSDIDELDQARGVADYFGTSHHEIVVRPEDFDLLPEIVWHLDEPIGDPIIIPTYLLSRLTHEYVKVVLTGEGADEILGGYVHQVCMTYGELYKSMVPGFIRSGVVSPIVNLASSKVLDRFFPYPASLGPDGKNRLVSYLRSPRYLSQSYSLLGSLFTEEDKEDLYTEDFARLVRDDKPEVDLFSDLRPEGNTLNRLIAHDLRTWLPDYTLFKQDKIAMSHSLETRVPFLDHRLVEFTARIPASLKLRGLTTKYILRKAMSGVLPKSAVHRKKQAFYMPVEECFRTGFEEFVAAILSESTVRKRGYFNYDYIQKVLQKAKDSPLIYNKQIMALVILELWHRLYVDELTSNLNRGEGTLAELSAKATICS